MKKLNCFHPELRPKKGKCGKEQIIKCHGEIKDHSCNTKKDQVKKSK